ARHGDGMAAQTADAPSMGGSPASPVSAATGAVQSHHAGDEAGAPADASRIPSGEALLVARDVAKSFRGVKALKGVSLEVRRGEILGLLGPNGSGKSTFINVASGHFPATSGSIVFRGQELVGVNAHRIARCGVSRTYQIPRPFAH